MVELSGQEESVFGESVTEIPESMELFHSMIIVVKEEVQKKKKKTVHSNCNKERLL